MTQIELNKVLEEHQKWLETKGEKGKKADLSYTNLSNADLRGANLSHAKLNDAILNDANLRGTDLSYANLRGAILKGTNLSEANLRGAELNDAILSVADLRGANLRGAKLRGATLRGANLDYSAFPLWCGGLDVHIDDRQVTQLLYHLIRNVLYSQNTSEELKHLLGSTELIAQANKFHRIEECGRIDGENA